jgi:hypothetical protein
MSGTARSSQQLNKIAHTLVITTWSFRPCFQRQWHVEKILMRWCLDRHWVREKDMKWKIWAPTVLWVWVMSSFLHTFICLVLIGLDLWQIEFSVTKIPFSNRILLAIQIIFHSSFVINQTHLILIKFIEKKINIYNITLVLLDPPWNISC